MKLKQLDAGAGQVYGVNDADDIFRLNGDNWEQVPGKLIHVSVGPAGVWGANRQNSIYKIQDGVWVNVEGSLKQVDAGGNIFIGGVTGSDKVYCKNQDSTLSRRANLPFTEIEGTLKYYSCGLYGCWGVNKYNAVFFRRNVTPTNCQGSEWQGVEYSMTMVEAGTDGSVYGIAFHGMVFKRQGISSSNPLGTEWSLLDTFDYFKHVSYDNGVLWLIHPEGNVYKCYGS
ncbi:fish-egg lectin-like [Pelobates cultripes]|uniref:Fish-egg lectin-like n=1 Tax=Pelobates cultripes TaxID=61616 RepID=A0AAD1TA55_PELCU|nr:fish-egg lectin-like [Pelobates cultripes]